MATESRLKDAIVARMMASGRLSVRLGAGPFLASGTPDILVLLLEPEGRAMFVEAKRPGERPTTLQEAVMARLRAAGAVAVVARSPEEAVAEAERAERSWREGGP